jgi:hypothetical protein
LLETTEQASGDSYAPLAMDLSGNYVPYQTRPRHFVTLAPYRYRQTFKNRSVLTSLPFPSTPNITVKLNANRMVDAMALAKVILSKSGYK